MAKLKDGFYKQTAEAIGSDLHVLLAGGGSKALSDFATASSLSDYVTLATAQTISGVKTFNAGNVPIKLNSTGNEVGVQFLLSGAAKGWVGHTNTKGTYIYNYPSGKYIGVKDDGTPYYHNGAFRTLLHSGNYSSYALPLSGGTLTSASIVPLTIKSTDAYSCIRFTSKNTDQVTFGIKQDGALFVTNIGGWSNEYAIYHQGNLTKVSQLTNDAGYLTSLPSHDHGYIISNATSKVKGLTYYTAAGVSETLADGNSWCKPAGVGSDGNSMILRMRWSSGVYGHDIFASPNTYTLWHRNIQNDTNTWRELLDSGNYNSYSPAIDGTGATGTWGINITGSAGSAGSASTANMVSHSTYYYSGNVMTNSTSSDTIFGANAKANYLFPSFMQSHPLWNDWADVLNFTGYCKWGGTQIATEYNAIKPRMAIRKFNQSRADWGDWTEFITSGNLTYQVGDWNSAVLSVFKSSENKINNAPTQDFCYGVHLRFHKDTANYFTDLVTTLYSDNLYYRRHTENGYSSWKRLAFVEDIPTSLPADGGNADTLDSIDSTGFFRTNLDVIPTSGDLANIPSGSYWIYENKGATNPAPATYSSLIAFGKSYYSPQLCVTHDAKQAWLRGIYNTSSGYSASNWNELAFKSDLSNLKLRSYTHTLQAGKATRITYTANALTIVKVTRTNQGGQLILIGTGYGEEGTVRNTWTELTPSSYFKWSLPQVASVSCAVEVYCSSATGDIEVFSSGNITFTDLSGGLTTSAYNKSLIHTGNIGSYIPTVTDYYWANINITSSPDSTKIPTLGGLNTTGVIQSSSSYPVYLTSTGTGVYNKTVIMHSADGLIIERARKTESSSGDIIPLIISQRGGGTAAKFYGDNLYVAGNIGVSTDSPYSKLEVAGTIADPDETSVASSAMLSVNRHLDDGLFFGFGSTTKGWIQSGYYGKSGTTSKTHAYNLVLNPLGGNVGIGTKTPKTKLDVNGAVLTTGPIVSNTYHQIYNSGSYTKASANVTGAIVIQLPITSSQHDMVNVEIAVYEYNSQAASKIIVGGHPWKGVWYNHSCSIIGGYSRGVRLGIYGGKWCIILGTSSTVWQYPGVFVTHIGTVYDDYSSSYASQCTLSLVTSESGFSALITPTNVVNATSATSATSSYYLLPSSGSSGHKLQFYSGQANISGNFYDGSSNDYKLYSFPTGCADSNGTIANVQNIRIGWGSTYWHDLFLNPNREGIWYRSVVSGTAGSWKKLAFTSDIPTSLPANGGDADTVDGYHAARFAKYYADSTSNADTIDDGIHGGKLYGASVWPLNYYSFLSVGYSNYKMQFNARNNVLYFRAGTEDGLSTMPWVNIIHSGNVATYALKNYGADNSRPNGSTFTLPGGTNAVSARSGATSGADIGIFYLSDDNAFICNSSDNAYLFATFDTDKTADFSSSDNAAFVVLSNHEGVKSKGDLSVGGLINSTCNGLTLTIGSQNTSWCHYSTNAPCHWFNKQVEINGALTPHSNNTYSLGSSTKMWGDFYTYAGYISTTLSTALPTYNNAPLKFGKSYNNDDSSNYRYRPWFAGEDLVNNYGYGVTVSCGLYRDPGHTNGGFYIGCGWDDNANSLIWKFSRNGNFYAPGELYASHFYENSDANLKNNIKAILDSDNIPVIKEFDWKSDGTHSYGLIAQELEEQGYSELVSDSGSHKTVNYSAALSLIVGKLQNKIKELEAEIENLKLRA